MKVLEKPRTVPHAADIAAVTTWLAEQRTAANKHRAAFPDVREFAPTAAQLEARDFRSLVAGGWVLL